MLSQTAIICLQQKNPPCKMDTSSICNFITNRGVATGPLALINILGVSMVARSTGYSLLDIDPTSFKIQGQQLSEFWLIMWACSDLHFFLFNSFFVATFHCRDRIHLRWRCWVKTGLNWHASGLVSKSRSCHPLLIAKVAWESCRMRKLHVLCCFLCLLVALESFVIA